MCGRFSIDQPTATIEARFGALFTEGVENRLDVRPTSDVPTVRQSIDERLGELMRWGLVPAWSKSIKIKYLMINARAESLLEKKVYREMIEKPSQRCLIVADGFYEWQSPEKPSEKSSPIKFTVDGGQPFAFAGLWSSWQDNGSHLHSCTIITCKPNEIVRPVHNRMPVVLGDQEAEDSWLDPLVETKDAVELLKPLDDTRMSAESAIELMQNN